MAYSPRQNAIRMAQSFAAFQPLFMDTETTGLGPFDHILEISIVDYNGIVLLDTLVKPKIKIPMDAYRIHGISDEMVVDAPEWKDVWEEAKEIFRGKYVGIYNADFDIRMMQQSHTVHDMIWDSNPIRSFCIMKLFADFNPYGRGKFQRLEQAGKQCGISIPNSHRAREDTLLAREVFNCMNRSS